MKRNNLLDLFRVILTIFVLLYHLGLCKAGFLAVCGFFVISGYLLARKIDEYNFSIKEYYLNRLKTLYLPLILVTFSTVFVFKYIIDIPWVTIKKETLSVVLNYNNFFQISANNNYFIRSDASPFTHMWYISLLIQIEFIIPLITTLLKEKKIKTNKNILFLLTLISIACFVLIDKKYGMAVSYYNTLSRLFSFLIGYSIYYFDLMSFSIKPVLITLCFTIGVFFVGDLSQTYYVILMIMVSVLSAIYILLSNYVDFKEIKIIKKISAISYYVYLVQYPVIYIIDTISNFNNLERVIVETTLIVVLSIVYNFALSKKDNQYKKPVLVAVLTISFIGACAFLTGENQYKQMQELERQLEINQGILAEKQKEYFDSISEKQKIAVDNISQINDALANIDETTKNSPILFIGDSIMLGGSFNLDEYFNNYYCDAKGSRNGFLAYDTLSELLNQGIDSEYIVIHLGTNSGLELEEVEKINTLITDQKILWLTVTNGWRKSENPMLEEYCNKNKNHYLADWYNYSLGHKEYFGADGLHLSENGRQVYDQFIFDNLKEIIKKELQNKKEELINGNSNNNGVSFYGNDILINLYNQFNKDYRFYINSNYNYKSLYKQLEEDKDNLCLSKTIFILLDNSVTISNEEIDEIYKLLNNNEVYIYAYNQNVNDLSVILNDSCYLSDDIHLNRKGNKIILKEIEKCLEN